jgi:ATPase subunit of ABC transporter with duplicated ATPase domains
MFSGTNPLMTYSAGGFVPSVFVFSTGVRMLTAHHIHKSYQTNEVLVDVSFSVNAGERVGLIGPNGCGKTTLLRILTGEEKPDSGHVRFTPSNLRVGYLPQGFAPPPNSTVKSLIQQATDAPELLEVQLSRLAASLAENPEDAGIQRAYDDILHRLQSPSSLPRLQSILAAFNLDTIPDEQIAATLSGGQKTRLSLALVLLSDPQLLLLDEPTNHLDIEMLTWLENWLNQFRGAALIVTHDRTF